MEIKDIILKYVLQNAIRYEGKAQPGAVMGKVFSEASDIDKKEVAKLVQATIKDINKLSLDAQKAKLMEIAPELLEKKKGKERKELPELKNAVIGKVVTRLPPEPSKYNHIGHAMSFLINYLYAKKYEGKCILRFEDTNPLKATQEFVDAMTTDVLEYLDIKPDKVVFASDDLPLLYSYAEKLIIESKAYVCLCKQEDMRKLRHEGGMCNCRECDPSNNLAEWKKMLNKEFKGGEAVLRLKGDMCSDNHCMRDPVMFRIVYAEHYRQKNKYCVWPMYDFENAIEDSINGVTHILRSNEFGTMRIELQNHIKDMLGLSKQTIIHYGRFNISGATTQGRVVREMIEKGEVIGWDDPRLVTLRALKRRGIDRRMYYELVYMWGLNQSPTFVDWDLISATNRKIIDKEVNRYFFVADPKLIKIEGAPEQTVKLHLHPDFEERGDRVFKTKDEFYVAENDFKQFKDGKLYRLMDCLNFKKKGSKFVFDSREYEKFRANGERIIHWLPKGDLSNVDVMMPDASWAKGLGERAMKNIKLDEVVQAERFGFIKLDKKEKDKLVFWYTHK